MKHNYLICVTKNTAQTSLTETLYYSWWRLCASTYMYTSQ